MKLAEHFIGEVLALYLLKGITHDDAEVLVISVRETEKCPFDIVIPSVSRYLLSEQCAQDPAVPLEDICVA